MSKESKALERRRARRDKRAMFIGALAMIGLYFLGVRGIPMVFIPVGVMVIAMWTLPL